VGRFVVLFVQAFVFALFLLVLGRVLMSWVDPRFSSTLGRFLYETTEPLLAPIRRVLPQTGFIDLSPLVLMLLLSVLLRVVGV
jgi:YggT family protein